MKKISIFTALLLTSSCFINTSTLKAGGGNLVDGDEDILIIEKVGRSKFIESKAEKKAEAQRLSHKGDLPTDQLYAPQRRRFFTRPDGDCFFWGVDVPRAEAVELWLRHSNNAQIREWASNEIYDEFMANKLPAGMQQDREYIRLKDLINECERIVLFRRIYLQNRKTAEDEIKNYCKSEDVYRAYVQQALTRHTDHMLYAQEGPYGARRPYFIDILAHIKKKNLVIWIYSEDKQSLIKSHNYSSGHNINGTWELLYDEGHYTRMVPITDQAGLAVGLQRENEDLTWLQEVRKEKARRKIEYHLAALRLDQCERLSRSRYVSASDQRENAAHAQKLKRQWANFLDSNPLLETKKAAYYQILLNMALQEVAKLENKLEAPPTPPSQIELTMSGKNNQVKAVVDAKLARIREYQNSLPALHKALESLRGEIRFYQEALQDIYYKPSEADLCDVLLQLSLYYGTLAEECEGRARRDPLTAHKKDRFLAEKQKFGNAYEKLQTALFRDIDYQIRVKSRLAGRSLAENLKKDLKLENTYSFTKNFDDALAEVNDHYRAFNGTKFFNPCYLSEDPFLQRGVCGLEGDDISDQDWKTTFPQQLYRALLYFLVPEANREFVMNNIRLLNHYDNGDYQREFRVQRPALNDYKNGFLMKDREIPFVSEDEVARLSQGEFTREVLIEIFTNLTTTFNRLDCNPNDALADQKKLAKKRIRRIIDKYKENALITADEDANPDLLDAIGKIRAALVLCQNESRCFDGISSALDGIENDLFRDAGFAETEISQIFAENALDFCEKFKALYPRILKTQHNVFEWQTRNEWNTNVGQFVKQMTFDALPHQGERRTKFYCLPMCVRNHANGILAPKNLMRTFLKGGVVQTGDSARVDFEAFTAEKAIDLVYGAYLKGLQKSSTGRVLKYDNIVDIIGRDAFLNHLYHEFSDKIEDENPPPSEFFGINDGRPVFKRALFEYLLERLGYVINTHSRWKNDRVQFAQELQDKEKAKVHELAGAAPAQGSIPRLILESDSFVLPEDPKSFTVDPNGKIVRNGKVINCKRTLPGNVEFITCENGILKLNGWSADTINRGASETVTLVYKGRVVGSTAVNQPRDLNSHFGGYNVPGNYSQVGFGGTFPFPESNDPNFDPSDLKVIALSKDGDVNFLYVPQTGANAPTIHRGEILSDTGNVVAIKKTVRGDAIQGVVEALQVDQTHRKLTLSGWSADIGKGTATQKICVFYKGKFIGQGEVGQPSASIVGHYGHYGIPGNYEQSGFNFTVDFPWWMNAVNPDDLQVVGFGEDGDANFVYVDKAKVIVK